MGHSPTTTSSPPPPSLRVSTSSLSRSSSAAASRRRTFCSPIPPSSRCLTTTGPGPARSAPPSLPYLTGAIIVIIIVTTTFRPRPPSPLTPLTVRPSSLFSPHSRPHLINYATNLRSLFFGRRLLCTLRMREAQLSDTVGLWPLTRPLARSLAGSRTHCSLFLHRLHSLTASLRRLTNRSLLLLSSLSLSLSPLLIVSSSCI